MSVQTETFVQTRSRVYTPLLEREPELQRLRAAVADARNGQGRLVLVEGHAGIGKSRLLDAAVEDARSLGVRVLQARGSELEREVPFGVAVQLLEPCIAGAAPTERELLLADAAGLAGPLLTGGGAPDARRAGHALHHGLFWVVSNLAERGAVLLTVDDAQWADESSLRFLAYLAQRLDSLPVAVIAATQFVTEGFASELLDRLSADGRNERVVPRPLTAEGVGVVVEARLGAPPEEGFVKACATATGGNPFLVAELSRVLAAEKIPPRANAAARVGLLATESIARSVLLRLGRLPGGATALSRAAAVLGDGASLRHAAALAGLNAAAAGSAADALASAEILRPGEPLGFVHSIVRASIYAELPRSERAENHARAARLLADDGLPAERIAAQLLPGRPARAAWAVETLRGAATRALARGTPRSAVRYLRRALAEPPEPEVRPGVLLALGEAEAATGDGRAVERFEEAAELAEDSTARASALEAAGRALHAAGRPRDAAQAFERALAALNGTANDDRDLALRLEADWVTAARLDPGLRPRAVARLERLQSERTDPSTHAGRALVAHAAHERALSGAPRAEVRALAHRALGEEEAAGMLTRRLALDALIWADELEEASLVVEIAVSDARRTGSIVAFAAASRYRARVFHRLGRITEALADTEAAAREPGAESRRAWPAMAPLLVHLLVERGELERAAKALSPLTLATPEADALTLAELVAARGRLRLVQGRPRLAQQDFTEAGRRLDEVGIVSPAVLAWRSGASLAAVRLGDHETAAALAAEELELARAADAPRATGLALRSAALAESDADVRANCLAKAADALEGAGDRLEHARTLGELGMLQREQGDLVKARECLRRALDCASATGAPALARGIREELVAAGARPRRTSSESAATLTPSERRVAELAAQGLTNRQIAQALFVTVKTVEWHLRNAFVKLRITSRRELQPVLREAA